MPRGDEDRITFDGGIEELERLFRMSPTSKPSLDAIIVSVDLETSGIKRKKPTSEQKRGLGRKGSWVRYLRYPRHVPPPPLPWQKVFNESMNERMNERMKESMSEGWPELPKPKPPMISTQQFSTSHASGDFEDCDTTDFKECIFSRTRYIAKDNLNDIIARYLQFPEDTTNQDTKDTIGLRTVVIVGHSPERDLEIIHRLGVSINRIAPIVAIIDSYRLSKYILGSNLPLGKYTPLQIFALSNVLTELGIPYSWYDLHNAGNDATYTLYALIMLAARWTKYKGRTAAAAELRTFSEGEAIAPR